jgi:LemA protein
MIITIAIIFLVAAVIWVGSLYRDLARQKNSLEGAWDDLNVLLKKKVKLAGSLLDVSNVFMPQETTTLKNLSEAKIEITKKETPLELAQAELKLNRALSAMLAVTDNSVSLKKDHSFLKIQDELKETEMKILAAKRFYNVNVVDFNDKFKSFFKNIVAKIASFKKRDFYDAEARENVHFDYRNEINQYRAEEINRCKQRCELYDYKKNFGTDYIILIPSIVLTLLIVGVAVYAFYSFFRAIPIADKLSNQIASQSGANNNQPTPAGPTVIDSSWKTYGNGIFEIKYPANWQVNVEDSGALSLKEIETNANNYSGIDIEIEIGKIDNPDNLPLAKLLSDTVMMGDNFSMQRNMEGDSMKADNVVLGGKNVLQIQQVISGTAIGMYSDYLVKDKVVYFLDSILYNKDDQKDIAIEARVLETLKFLN